MARETMEFDVVIVGAGPAGLSASIRLMQLNPSLNVCIIDKAEEIGGHILSGAALEPRALNELLPHWQQEATFIHTPIIKDEFLLLTQSFSFRLPTPPQMQNHGNYIISLGEFCRWLATQAEKLGVNIFPGFAATEIIYENDAVAGIITGDKGVTRLGEHKPNYQPGMELRAKQVMFAEGCRGSLTQSLIKKYDLAANSDPQTYGIGIKELWEIPANEAKGTVIHSAGWPLDTKTYGGSFVYQLTESLVAIGFVIGLDYRNPYLNPYEEFQRFKTHPRIKKILQNGKRIAYGARTLVEGGIQSLPKLTVPGGLIIGDAAGFLNVAKIKGTHNAMKSGMVAAESIVDNLVEGFECQTYLNNIKKSWLWNDLWHIRNIRPAFRWGLIPGLAYAALDTYILRGKAPWTFHRSVADNESLQLAKQSKPIVYPKHDHIFTFDLSASVFLANVKYDENQRYHLRLKDKIHVPVDINLQKFDAPETRYCPAGVYEFLYSEEQKPRLQINGGNCIHCKACDIKDPTQNITWTPSEGGSGPNYQLM